ncbi:mannose-6-phosphate isomerase, class I [Sediminibacterium ginsengisoli]|uniref:mannose-6-phosphate isomerase n=1 Tax=Sediminibacterium ginsengisoli TaxID=413434 RepID=A0A1T4PJS6_9BACT|nr:mannose-6-phosphate isomerase, class I [Sediminibacterium ginsengisoli]SJZ91631.1 mannose-6-phosphate isomerase, type 1 [Sediminibacterium ginsengisoli]
MVQIQDKILRIEGKVQHYAWGGVSFIPDLLGIDNKEGLPFAEYWLGAHPSASAIIQTSGGNTPLNTWISAHPVDALSERVYRKFGELPYLFKVLDVREMLSIQVHPSRSEAEKGFDNEEKAGIPIGATQRNYKDRNHKPEITVALSNFWLLHGFKTSQKIEETLLEVPGFNILIPIFRREGIKGLYRFVMEMEQPEVNTMLSPLVRRALRQKSAGELTRQDPHWWVAKFYAADPDPEIIDRGIFSIFFFNIVNMAPGEAIFQGAGVPHAYLEGQNMELMANSDNVLRGGLTPKHIDVPELMKHILFDEVKPAILTGISALPGELVYPCPVPDFGISRISLTGGMSYESRTYSLEIIIAMEGGALVNNSTVLKRGDAVAILPDTEYTIESSGSCVLFRALVPLEQE